GRRKGMSKSLGSRLGSRLGSGLGSGRNGPRAGDRPGAGRTVRSEARGSGAATVCRGRAHDRHRRIVAMAVHTARFSEAADPATAPEASAPGLALPWIVRL